MPEEEPNFQTKPVEAPIFDSQVRDQVNQNTDIEITPKTKGGGFGAFFKANKIYFLAILVGVLVIGILAYFAFRKVPQVVKEANISFAIDASETVASGSEIVYKFKIENKDTAKLVNLQLELVYPDGINYIDSTPKALNMSGTLFNVPDLISGQNAVVIIKAKASGSVNETKSIVGKLHYKYSNFNSEFVKEQEASVRLVASNVFLEISGPQSANNSQLVVYEVKYRNDSKDAVNNARITVNYPEGFIYADSNPKPDIGNNTWNISELLKDGNGSIQIQGNFMSVNAGETKTTLAQFLILGSNGDYFTQNTSEFSTAISSLPLLVSQSMDTLGNVSDVVHPGDTLNFSISYQNNSDIAATGVNIFVTLDSKALDLSTLKAQSGQTNNNVILWNASLVPKLAQLMPNESGKVSFSVKVNNPATRDSTKNLKIISSVKIQSNEYQAPFPGNELSLKISSPVSVSTKLEYVSGSIPPQVGKITTYKVTLSLTNSSNDYKDAVLTSSIPLAPGSVDTASFSQEEANNVEFNSSTGKLTWKVGMLLANTGKFSQSRTLSLNLRLSPNATQVGQNPLLMNDIRLSAKDTFTDLNVDASAKKIDTTNIPNGQSQGRVVK